MASGPPHRLKVRNRILKPVEPVTLMRGNAQSHLTSNLILVSPLSQSHAAEAPPTTRRAWKSAIPGQRGAPAATTFQSSPQSPGPTAASQASVKGLAGASVQGATAKELQTDRGSSVSRRVALSFGAEEAPSELCRLHLIISPVRQAASADTR
jgi:hypothetical protein